MADTTIGTTTNKRNLLRVRSDDGHARVGFVELFFDLIFVFAITQVSHLLLHHLTPVGAVQSAMLLIAVWWAWIYTTWVTNWLDPETTRVRLLLFALMIVGLVMAASLPKAFESRAIWFALAYVATQVGRSLFMAWALSEHDARNCTNFKRISAWFAASGALWIVGALIGGPAMMAIWMLAIAIELAGPWVGFWTPVLGRSSTSDWSIAGGHMAERCGLFIIICLGESILLTGATFADLAWNGETMFNFLTCVIGSISMWWIYFNVGAERASRLIAASDNPGGLGRLAYTYIHVLIVAGVILSAAADEIVLKHPNDALKLPYALLMTGGPAVFLAGCLLFKWTTAGRPPLSHMVGLALLASLFMLSGSLSVMTFGAATTSVMVLVAIWESLSLGDEIEQGRAQGHGHVTPVKHGEK